MVCTGLFCAETIQWFVLGDGFHWPQLQCPVPSTSVPCPSGYHFWLDPMSMAIAKLNTLASYHQVPLMKAASFLMTFLLPSGTYHYLWAPMGLSSSSDEFFHHSDAVFAGLPGIHKLVDDILVEGNNLKDLEAKICAVLQQCCEHRFILSKKKFEVGPKSTSPGSLSPLPASAHAQVNLMPSPNSLCQRISHHSRAFLVCAIN